MILRQTDSNITDEDEMQSNTVAISGVPSDKKVIRQGYS